MPLFLLSYYTCHFPMYLFNNYWLINVQFFIRRLKVCGILTCFFFFNFLLFLNLMGFCTSSVCSCTEVLWNWGTLPWGPFYMSSERVELVSCAAIVLISIIHTGRSWTINPRDTITDLNKSSCCARSAWLKIQAAQTGVASQTCCSMFPSTL